MAVVEVLSFQRLLKPRIFEAMSDTPVVVITGPRQSGKTTLSKQWVNQDFQYITLDDELTALSAQEDPTKLINSYKKIVIDEVQRVPSLLKAIKISVDENRKPGRFLLTGSSNLMTIPTVAESLAGRMETLSLFPLSQSEIEGNNENWLDNIFNNKLNQPKLSQLKLTDRVLRGGFPEMVSRPSSRRRVAWARQYIDSLVQRDVRDIADIENLDRLPRFLTALAQVAGQLCNYTQLGAQVQIDAKTAAKYVAILEQIFLLRRIDVWAPNRLSRVIKTPKIQFLDSGLLSTLLELTTNELTKDRNRFGKVLESFVFSELIKHIANADGRYQVLYYRDTDKNEVDFIVENGVGDLVAIEIKAATTVRSADLKSIRKLATLAGNRLKVSVVFYDGNNTLPIGNNIWAVPIASLWGNEVMPID